MPKSAVIPSDPTEGAVVHSAINGINEVLLKGYVSAIESEDAKMEEIMRKAREACEPHITEIKEIKKKAATNGIPKGPLSAKMRERKFLRKADSVSDILTEEQKDIFEEISAKLGDFPLFESLGE